MYLTEISAIEVTYVSSQRTRFAWDNSRYQQGDTLEQLEAHYTQEKATIQQFVKRLATALKHEEAPLQASFSSEQ